MIHAHTTQINTCKTVFFYQKATMSALCMLHLTTPSFRYRTKPWANYHDQKSVACDNCSDWYHTSCMHINSYHYNVLQKSNISWICNNCGIPNFSSSIFESAEVTTSNSFQDISNEDLLMNDTSATQIHLSFRFIAHHH